MPLRDPLILAADVQITPSSALSPGLRRRLGAALNDAAISRLRGRAPAKLIDRQATVLLECFRHPRTVAEAVHQCAAQFALEPEALLRAAFPLLRDCYNSRFLVPADSDDALPTLPSRARGDPVGSYRILRCLQVLEDTELYQARDRSGGLAAVKLARPGRTSRVVFTREAAALARLEGRHVPRVLASGTHQRRPWLAMSWCDGVPPEIACRELRSPATRPALLGVLTSVARAYAELHQRGVLHGDVHPGNLLIGLGQSITLVDFGLARPIAPLRLAGRAPHGAVLEHIAPEQARVSRNGGDLPAATAASEQYAVGVLLYRLATGSLPYEASLDRATMIDRICGGAVLSFARHGVFTWPPLEAVLRRMMDREPSRRFGSMVDVVAALDAIRTETAGQESHQAGSQPSDLFNLAVRQFEGRVASNTRAFRRKSRAPHGSLMLGRTGTAYALYRIAMLRSDPAMLSLADLWLARVEQEAGDPCAFESPDDGLEREGLGLASPFHTRLGVATTRVLLAIATGDLSAAQRATGRISEESSQWWSSRDLTLGRAGVPLAIATVLDALPPAWDALRPGLEQSGRAVLGATWDELERLGPMGAPGSAEDFGAAHGWAGILMATLRWHAATGDPLPASLEVRLDELVRGAEPLGRGVHWPQRVTGAAPSLLATNQVAGWCNGPAGFVPLFAMAATQGVGDGLDRVAERAAWSSWEAPSEVFDLCCGLTGRAYGLLSYYRMTGDPAWLRRAEELGRRAIRRFRSARGGLPRPFSLFKGEAGLALLAADLQVPDRARFPFYEPEGFPPRLRDGRPA